MQYQEERESAKGNKQDYVDGFERLINARQKAAAAKRDEYAKDILTEPERYRRELCAMLGWPLTEEKPTALPTVQTECLSEEGTHAILRLRVEILEGLWMSGLLFLAKGEGKRPLVLVQHGGLGTPEFISGFYGETGNYNDMLTRVIRHGVHAFAPQLLLWSDDYGVPFHRQTIDARLKHLGSSVTAVELFGLTRILDYLEAQPYVSTLGMVGLSYGGFYTLFTAAIDTRIRAALSCAYFNSRDNFAFADWTWWDAASRFDDGEIALLVHPRKLYLRVADRDPLFDPKFAHLSFEAIQRHAVTAKTEWLDFAVFEGVHEFIKDDDTIERLIKDLTME